MHNRGVGLVLLAFDEAVCLDCSRQSGEPGNVPASDAQECIYEASPKRILERLWIFRRVQTSPPTSSRTDATQTAAIVLLCCKCWCFGVEDHWLRWYEKPEL